MKYKELYSATNGVFAQLKSLHASVYETLFGDTETVVLDAYAYFIASERTLVPLFTTETQEAYLNAVFYEKATSWQKMFLALTGAYDVAKPNTTIVTTAGNDTTDTVGNVTDINSDKAFNSSDYVGKDKSEQTTDNNNARKYDETKTTVKGTDNVQLNIEREIRLRARHSVLKMVTTDIINTITLSVYE